MKASETRILVVDDAPENIQILASILSEEYEVLFAFDGETALNMLKEERVDLVLLDIEMPGIDGYEVCRQIKDQAATADIPVIFITARNNVEDETRGLEAGAVDYIKKPFSLPIVRARVRNHVELKVKSDTLERLAHLDGLTGISNRRHFEVTVEREWRRCRRSSKPLSLLMLDIDYFKQYNDHYGHLAGDDCLRRVGACLAAFAARAGDFPGRYGGEEFVILLPETTSVGAQDVARRVIEGIRDLDVEHVRSAVAKVVTASIGVVTMVPSGEGSRTSLIRAADEALYMAKEAGRNRFQVAAGSTPGYSSKR